MTSPQNTKPSKWVFRSTPASLESKQFSVLAVFETLFVLVLYFGLAYYFHYQWWLLLAALAAPLILLRSKPSIALGLKRLKRYHDRSQDDISKLEKVIITIFILSFSFAISYYLANAWLTDYQDWESLFKLSILGLIMIAITGQSLDAITGTSATVLTVIMIITVAISGAIASVVVSASIVAGAIASVVVSASIVAGVITLTFVVVAITVLAPPVAYSNIYSSIALALGTWLRSIFIRLSATLQHPIAGLKQLPDNMQEILWRLDFTHLPELLPKAKEVDKLYSVDGIISKTIRAKQKDLTGNIGSTVIAILWYIPAILWRWSLKATLWLWWPIALLLRPSLENKTLDDVRDHAVCKVTFVNFWILPILSGIIILWLLQLSVQQTQTILELLPEWASSLLKLLNQFPSLELGLRYVLLLLCCLLSLIIWYKSYRLASWHKTLLADEFKLKELDEKGRERFRKRVESLEVWCTIRIFAFIFFGYSVLLYLAYQYYPDDIVHLIPAGLSGYL